MAGSTRSIASAIRYSSPTCCRPRTRQARSKVLPDALLAANFARIDAPVSFPPIWGVPWFSWAQYDASVQNELVRNAGEALGVNARVNLREYGNQDLPTFRSSVQMQNIFWFEELLAGPHPLEGTKGFKGLTAPKWDDAAKLFPGDPAWAIKDDLVKRVAQLYRRPLCRMPSPAGQRPGQYGAVGQ